MSKVTKFLSLGIDMMKALPEDHPLADRDYWKQRRCFDEGRMDKVLIAFKEWLKEQGRVYVPKMSKATDRGSSGEVKDREASVEATDRERYGKVRLAVSASAASETCHPVLAEVRFYPKHGPMAPGDEYKADGHIDFIRKVTDEEGRLTCEIPEGDYLVRFSKGSEYTIEYSDITVRAGETLSVSACLTRFADLEKEGYFAGDIHHHSIYSSPVWGGTDDVIESPKEVADSMRALGLRFGALSDHHNILNHEEWKKTGTEDFLPIPSKEISTSNGHVLSLGVDGYDVIYDIPHGEARTEERLRNEFIRMTDEIKAHGGVAQLNHPRDHQVSISWNKDFYDMTDIFETIEIWNGSNPMYFGTTNALAADFWRDLLEQGRFIPATTGSDTHNTRADDYHKLNGEVLWFAEEAGRFLSEDHGEFAEERKYLEFFKDMTECFGAKLEVWAKTCLTSGCVRTYVNIPGKPERKEVLSALKDGRSFLTNGPILELKVNGAGPGETAVLKEAGTGNPVSVRVRANRPVDRVILYYSGYGEQEISLKDKVSFPAEDKDPHKAEGSGGRSFEYAFSLSDKELDLSGKTYIFAVAVSDMTNLAITNPVRLV